MNVAQLNLARKWRSKTFDQIVGQQLSVRMLKNSLYLGQYFPVYLFAGQRGCGKTTTARVFAAAINCEQLPHFQKDPRNNSVPCLVCQSCKAMASGKHPDFVEMDAASHTGVDNVRQIVDSSSLLPLMGRKKVYLIDEAHMLSKAAFNAFLKILEEPPASVLFILATTDTDKIIETVKSRCFQLFFQPIEMAPLHKHLAHICQQEDISFEPEALDLIISETHGSARDALNLLEQVRFSSSSVDKQAALTVLGHVDESCLISLLQLVLRKQPIDLLNFMQEMQLEKFSAPFIWHKLIELTRASLWLKYGVSPHTFGQYHQQLQEVVAKSSVKQLHALLEALYVNEPIFARTTGQHTFLEMVLLQLCQKNRRNNDPSTPATQQVAPPSSDEEQEDELDEDEDGELEEEDEDEEEDECKRLWRSFIKAVEQKADPLVFSVYKQAQSVTFDQNNKKVMVSLSPDLTFFNDKIEEQKIVWQPLLNASFGMEVFLQLEFTGTKQKIEKKSSASKVTNNKLENIQPHIKKQETRTASPYAQRRSQRGSVPRVLESKIDVSDAATWQQARMLLECFPGMITEVKE